MKRIITLTTDFGLEDHYVGSMKGVILGINKEAVVTDVTHQIPRHDIFKAAFTLRNFYRYFPNDSIHVVVVDPGVGSNRRPIVVKTENGVFVGPDNGVFTFILQDSKQYQIYEITNEEYMLDKVSTTFHGRDIFAPAAAHLSLSALSADIEDFGQRVDDPQLLDIPSPKFQDEKILGEIIYSDSFGNMITNISSDIIGSSSKIHIGKHIIDTVSNSYSDVPEGELLAIIGSSGFLEISVNKGRADEKIRDFSVCIIK